jgi:hypothetical protein
MTRLVIEHVHLPAGAREARARDAARQRADDDLAGRTVWCAGAPPDGRRAADTLRTRLTGQLPVRALPLALQALEETLDELLAAADALGARVTAGDVVVLHDALSARLAEALRDHAAHVVWHMEAAAIPRTIPPGVDAYVVASGRRIDGLIPSNDVISSKDVAGPDDGALDGDAWSSLLAEVVGADRADVVGGTRHARPLPVH